EAEREHALTAGRRRGAWSWASGNCEQQLRRLPAQQLEGVHHNFDVLPWLEGRDCEHVRGAEVGALAVRAEPAVDPRIRNANPLWRDPKMLGHVGGGEA